MPPWEKYKTSSPAGPWAKYGAATQIAAPQLRPGYLPADTITDSDVVTSRTGPNGEYIPRVLPVRRGLNGLEMVHSDLTRGVKDFAGAVVDNPGGVAKAVGSAIWDVVDNPRKALTGELSFDEMKRAGFDTAGMIATGGIATPNVLIPAGVAGMNAIGPPARAVGRGLSATGRAVVEPLVNRFGDMNSAIGRSLLRRVMQDNPGLSPDDAIAQVEAQLARMGAPSMIADTGKSSQKLARNMAQGSGETAQFAEKALGERSATQGTRLIGSVRENISPKNFHEELDAIELRQKEMAGPLYKESFDANRDMWSNEIGRILETKAGREAFETARDRMSNRMKKLGVPDEELTAQMKELVEAGKMDPVKGGVSNGLKLEFLDLIKQDLGDQEQRLKRAVIAGSAKKGQMVEVGDLRRDLTSELDRLDVTAKAGPNSTKAEGGAYARARRVYSDEASLKDAMEQGRGFVKGDQEVTEKLFKGLTDGQKEAFRIGVAREMAGMISNTGMLPAALRNVLQDNTIKARLKFLTPDEQSFTKLIGDIEREVTFQKTSNAVRGGSPTGSIIMEEGQIAGDVLDNARRLGGAASDLMTGNKLGAIEKTANFLIGKLRQMQMPTEMRDKIGRLLISTDPQDKKEAIRLMRAAGATGGPGLSSSSRVSGGR